MPTTPYPSDVESVSVTASNAELIRWVFDMLNNRDVSALKQVSTDETVDCFPDRTCHGVNETVAYFEEAFAALPDWHMEVIAIAEQGEDVFVRWQMTGTHTGPLLGIAPTGKAIAIEGIDHFVIRDGKIVSSLVAADQLQYARQIGMMPVEGSIADRLLKGAFNAYTRLARKFAR